MTSNTIPGLLTLLAAAMAHPTLALAEDVHCPPNLGSVTIDGNVLIAARCRLEGTVVKGNVHLYAGGSLIARGPVRIEGSVQADNADFVDIEQAHVNGSIQLNDLVGDRSVISGTTVGGSIQLKGNRSRLEVLGSSVQADVQAFTNTGGVVIADNTIDGNLQCKSNAPTPAGGNNRVQGNKEDQCANLQPESGSAAPVGAPPVSAATSAAGGSSSGGGAFDLMATLLLGLFLLARRALMGSPRD